MENALHQKKCFTYVCPENEFGDVHHILAQYVSVSTCISAYAHMVLIFNLCEACVAQSAR